MNVLNTHRMYVHESVVHETKRETKLPPPQCDLNCTYHSSECCDRQPGSAMPRIFTKLQRKQNGICIEWNQGNCQHEDFCSKEHVEITECRFGTFCNRADCYFWHSFEGRFPFLGVN